MFELKRKEALPLKYPDFIENEKEKIAFRAVYNRIKDIKKVIENSAEPLKKSEYKISKSALCIANNLSGSYIAKHEKLNKYVEQQQYQIERLAKDLEEKEADRSYTANKPEQMRKDELVSEVKSLRKRLKNRESELYVEQLKYLLDTGFSEAQNITKRRIKMLEDDVKELNHSNAVKESHIKELTRSLTQALHRLQPMDK
jgi:hypothetical protein